MIIEVMLLEKSAVGIGLALVVCFRFLWEYFDTYLKQDDGL